MLYLDFAATCPVDDRVLEAMEPWWRCGNPASGHRMGRYAADAVARGRTTVADAIGAHPGEIVFTSGATEADNLALFGYAEGAKKPQVVTVATEHKAVLRPAEVLGAHGVPVTVLPVDRYGLIDLGRLWKAAAPGALVSVMAVNNETGVTQPLHQIGAICRAKGALFHCDAAQGLGRLRLDVEALKVDMLSLSAHKLYGPKGIGALYIREGTAVVPRIVGGRQEHAMRAGTSNAPLVVGFARAVDIASPEVDRERARLEVLRDQLIAKIQSGMPVEVHGHGVPGIVSLGFPNLGQDDLLRGCFEGICCSAGSACSHDGPSHVMKAMGVEHAVLRVSLGRPTTQAQVEQAAAMIVSAGQHSSAVA